MSQVTNVKIFSFAHGGETIWFLETEDSHFIDIHYVAVSWAGIERAQSNWPEQLPLF